MNVIFLGGLFPPQYVKEIEKNSKGVIQNAANLLQWSFVKGLGNFYKTEIITLPYIGAFPFLYKKIFIPNIKFNHISESSDISLNFFNLLLVKHFFRYKNAKRELIKRLYNTSEQTTIIIYSIHSPFLLAAIHAKKKFPQVRICLIVPDLPEYMSDNKNIFYLSFKKLDSYFINNALNEIDSYVVLSDEMVNALRIRDKPWVRIEGIFEKQEDISLPEKDENKVILYSGTLARRYGCMNLVEAFSKIELQNYQLWICGEGDTRKEIEQLAAINKKIKYFGQLPQEEVFKLQKRATILVNPRTSEGEFTKYSFPSKTMEYLASGTPTILHRLPGIPDEYFQFCYIAEEENSEGLKKKIIEVCEKSQTELQNFGKIAQDFILNTKNAVAQIEKVSKMIESL